MPEHIDCVLPRRTHFPSKTARVLWHSFCGTWRPTVIHEMPGGQRVVNTMPLLGQVLSPGQVASSRAEEGSPMNPRRHVRLLLAIGLIAGLLPVHDRDRHRGHVRPFDPGPGWLVRRNDPDLREHRPDRRPIRSQPTHRDGRLADLEQHLVGQLQRGLRRVGVRPGPPGVRWPAVIRGRRRSVHRDAVVPLRECVSRWLQHRDRSRDRPRR